MRAEHLDPISDDRWARFVDSAPGATPFVHPAWLDLLARSYRYKISAVCVTGDDGAFILGLPVARVESRLTGRRLVALPFSDVSPPVRSADADADADAVLFHALRDLRRSSGLEVEVRDALPPESRAHVVPRFLVHRLRLQADADAVLARTSKALTRGQKKARREGVTTRVGTDAEMLATFYRLHLRTRRRQGVPTQPRRFIMAFEQLFDRGLGYVMTAEHHGNAIAAAVFLTHGDTTVYKYGASDERHLSLRPNNLLFADAIRRACEAGHTTFDFGRTDFDNTGLAAFKRSWGADEQELAYSYFADQTPHEGSGRAHRLLAGVIRRGPLLTGQAIGTALYRHVG